MKFTNQYFHLETDARRPGFTHFALDSLGGGKVNVNLLADAAPVNGQSCEARKVNGHTVEYRAGGAAPDAPWCWRIEVRENRLLLTSQYIEGLPSIPLTLRFDRLKASATMLGLFPEHEFANAPPIQTAEFFSTEPFDCDMLLPAVLHVPDHGSLRITSTSAEIISYDAGRNHDASGFTRVSFPPAENSGEQREYLLAATAIYPRPAEIPDEPIYAGFKRNFLNALQLNPRVKVLTNSSAGGAGPFALQFYSAVAAQDAQLAEGLSTLDLLRQTLERYLSGFITYGMEGYKDQRDFLDSYPSLILAAADYVKPSGDREWLARHYPTLVRWAERIHAQDRDGDGLIEDVLSGNSGSWPEEISIRPSNWWDTIGFGHKDAYGNALAYRAFCLMSEMAALLDRRDDAVRFSTWAERLKALYAPTFLNPETGILAGWKSADGELHDYYFLFVNSAAICFDLLSEDLANAVMDRLLAKMNEVGYDRFDLGLPGNLVSVHSADYVHRVKRFGGGVREDNADGFQIYENGGATACYAYFTVMACYRLKRWADGDRIFAPMLEAFEAGAFQGRGDNGMTNDWRAWDGTPHGYESLLADGYSALLPVLERVKHRTPVTVRQ